MTALRFPPASTLAIFCALALQASGTPTHLCQRFVGVATPLNREVTHG